MYSSSILPRFSPFVVAVSLGVAVLSLPSPLHAEEAAKSAPPAGLTAPAAAAVDRLKGLAGDWLDADGTLGTKEQVVVTYRVTGAGSAVVETLFVGTPHEMVSVYHRDGTDLVMTHYCAAGNQPHMRAKTTSGNVLTLDLDGGTNLDPAKDSHIHSVRFEFISPDEIRADWVGWAGGKPADPVTKLHLKRRKVQA